ncbi:MAG: porin family protein [Geobacteraceae bacterium]|nr:porin family protein [Geobacteraceae bacterium]
MKKTLVLNLTCLVLVLFGTAAFAEHTGPYVGGYAGGNLLTFTKAYDNLGNFNIESDPALQYGGIIGWDLGPGSPVGQGRLELEYSHRGNKVNKVKFSNGGFAGEGDLTADSLLLNAYALSRDRSLWSPYVGVGLGAARIQASGLKVNGFPIAEGTSTVFAYQVGLGVDFAVSENVALDIGYRFFGTVRPTFTESNGQSLKMDYFSNSVLLGVRIGF